MNPSSAGWIKKFIKDIDQKALLSAYTDVSDLYHGLKAGGFIYGMSLMGLEPQAKTTLQLTVEEHTKINLLHALCYVYFKQNPKHQYSDCIAAIVSFYELMGKGQPGLLHKLSFAKNPSDNLEGIINARLHENNLGRHAEVSSLITYVLLFIDILVFQEYLQGNQSLQEAFDRMEYLCIQACTWALESKLKPNKYDHMFIEMLRNALKKPLKIEEDSGQELIKQMLTQTALFKSFLMDVCCLGVWDDRVMDAAELHFLQDFEKALALKSGSALAGVSDLDNFSRNYAQSVRLFEHANPVKLLYKQSSAMVKTLILRNKNRLIKELAESGELVKLLTLSTVRELDKKEKQKVKVQLLDICKTVPSLTLFLLPGGSLLLPLMVKLIPKLLPSAFNENAIDES